MQRQQCWGSHPSGVIVVSVGWPLGRPWGLSQLIQALSDWFMTTEVGIVMLHWVATCRGWRQ